MAIGLSLHIGVNFLDPIHYGSDGALKGCVNDAKAMYKIATGQGFESTLLLNEEASRPNIIRYLSQATVKLKAGGIFFISYSGHGGSIPDRSGDEDDWLDETWCLYDAQLIDDELQVFWSRFKPGVRILVVSDSCHSGTVLKPGRPENAISYSAETPRYLPREQTEQLWRNQQTFYRELEPRAQAVEVKASVRLLSGCQDNQYSYDGEKNGAFTTQLLQVWDDGRYQGNYQQFHKHILMRMPAYQSPNHWVVGIGDTAFDEQRPFQI